MPTSPILVTGGAGFIGSAVVRELLRRGESVVNLDALTYAGNPDSLPGADSNPRYVFAHLNINDSHGVRELLGFHRPRAIIHLAAESHVDRSIDAPALFIETNVNGTMQLLHEARRYWSGLPAGDADRFRFLHVSTDEVYGSLGETGLFSEQSPYKPSSPYAASKAASDHLVRAWGHTYGLPTIITNCSNNYGPYQFPEKLIPLVILNALEGNPLPVYGAGGNVRDWLHVEDHADALLTVLQHGRSGDTYNVGSRSQRRNIEVVHAICASLDEICPRRDGSTHSSKIEFVRDRPGHDYRYAIDPTKIERELAWTPKHSFAHGLAATVAWYVDNRIWWERVRSGAYRGERLGLGQLA